MDVCHRDEEFRNRPIVDRVYQLNGRIVVFVFYVLRYIVDHQFMHMYIVRVYMLFRVGLDENGGTEIRL